MLLAKATLSELRALEGVIVVMICQSGRQSSQVWRSA
jgi:hypothetical protein